MKPYVHSKSSAKHRGGRPEDYLDIHDWFDQTKAAHPDMRHRAILHNAMGIYIAETVFGTTRTNSDGEVYSVRDIGEQHVLEDMNFIPDLPMILKELPELPWLYGAPKSVKKMKLVD